ncbi:MAG: hypothetical protein C0425_00275 [Chlorobiaceae bacterium]|nr:hypothetical protein [Chlorobiaceae bacterium]MBA4308759.1 hypothetical protein [Chlorobiaceae bacterium]
MKQFFTKKEIFNIPNSLSLFRLFLIIPFWILFDNFHEPYVPLIIVGLAIFSVFTDLLDGYIARKYNQITEFGKIIDPLSDKICVGFIIVKLFLMGMIDPLMFSLIIGRDVLIFTLGIFFTKKYGIILASNYLGKFTVLIIGVLILLTVLQIPYYSLLYKFFYIATIIMIFLSLFGYGYRVYEFIKQKKNEVI